MNGSAKVLKNTMAREKIGSFAAAADTACGTGVYALALAETGR